MKDLRDSVEPDNIIVPINKIEPKNKVRFLFVKELTFNFKKSFKKNFIYYSLLILMILVMKYPQNIGYATGKWIKEFVNAFTEQIYQIKKRPSC